MTTYEEATWYEIERNKMHLKKDGEHYVADAMLFRESISLRQENDSLKKENEKLRELALEIWRSCPVSEDDCVKCTHYIEESEEDSCDIPILMEKLGVEV